MGSDLIHPWKNWKRWLICFLLLNLTLAIWFGCKFRLLCKLLQWIRRGSLSHIHFKCAVNASPSIDRGVFDTSSGWFLIQESVNRCHIIIVVTWTREPNTLNSAVTLISENVAIKTTGRCELWMRLKKGLRKKIILLKDKHNFLCMQVSVGRVVWQPLADCQCGWGSMDQGCHRSSSLWGMGSRWTTSPMG